MWFQGDGWTHRYLVEDESGRFWSGLGWVTDPGDAMPFRTVEEAEAFIEENGLQDVAQARESLKRHPSGGRTP